MVAAGGRNDACNHGAAAPAPTAAPAPALDPTSAPAEPAAVFVVIDDGGGVGDVRLPPAFFRFRVDVGDGGAAVAPPTQSWSLGFKSTVSRNET